MIESWYIGLAIMLISSIVIAKASNVFEVATDYLGRKMADGVKGLTLNAIGSSFPELLTTVFFLVFATRENLGRDLAASIGGNTGSAIFNSIIIPMMVLIVVLMSGTKKLNISKKVIWRDGLFLIAGEIILLVILSATKITHWHGWILAIFYVVYIAFALKTMTKKELHEHIEHELPDQEKWYTKYILKTDEGKTGRSWAMLLLAITIIGIACAGLVEGCKMVADSIHINPLFVALVLVAAASSVPDTIISMKDARKGNHDDALSNVLGSNIFDITISMGLPLALFLLFTKQEVPFEVEGANIIDIRVMLLIVTVVTIAIYLLSKNIGIFHIGLFAFLYLIFILYAIGAAQYHAGSDSMLAQTAGDFIEYLRKPGGLNDWLRSW
jgi:cation:H+ antiporter